MTLRRTLASLCFLLAAAAAGADQTVIWQSDWKAAFAAAKQQHRLVFVDFYATWCKPCQQMDATVFQDAEVLRRMSDFVLVRVDVDKSNIPRGRRISVLPTYLVYDPAERECARIVGYKPFDVFYDAVANIRSSAPQFLRAADLLDAKKDFDGYLLIGNTFSHLALTENARAAYQAARKAAQQQDDARGAQLADALSAFTFVRDDDPLRAITLLQKLAEKPVTPENEALIWLSIGNAYRAALDPQSAARAFQRVESVATSGSAMSREATTARAAAIAAVDDPVESELRKLQGKWVPVRVEADGKTLAGKKGASPVSIRFSRWTEKTVDGESASKFTIDPAKEPKQITVMQGSTPIPGIYVLDGDKLEISMAFPFGGNLDALKKRPSEFTTHPAGNFVVTLYERAPR